MKNISTQKERILQYLENKGISKNKFYIETGISNGVLDKKSGLTVDTVEKFISKYPDVNLMWLISGLGPMLVTDVVKDYGVNGITFVSEPGFVYQPGTDEQKDEDIEEFVNKSGNKFFIYPDGKLKVEVPLMTEPAYATYAEQFFDEAVVKDLPKATFEVDRLGKGNYLAFVIKNDSMWNEGEFDTRPGTEILCREVGRHLWPNFHKTDYGFVLMTSQGIFHKDIKEYDAQSGMLTLSSRNPDHKDFEISINNVNKVFSVIKQGEAPDPKKKPVQQETTSEKEEMYPQRYIDVLENTLKTKDTIIGTLKENNELLKESNDMLKEKLAKLEERINLIDKSIN